MVYQSIQGRQDDKHRNRFEVPNPFTLNVFPYRFSGPDDQFFQRKENPFVKMEHPMLDIVPKGMKVHSPHIAALAAIGAKISFEWSAAIQTINHNLKIE